MNAQKLWQQLTDQAWVEGQAPEVVEQAEQTPWFARILQGFAGWLAALFLLGFLGFGVAGLFEYGGVLIFMGLLLNASAYVFFKKNTDNDFFEQLVLVFSLTGQFLFAYGMFHFVSFEERSWFVVLGIYQILLVWLMNNYLHRFLSTWFAVIALFWGFESLVYSGLGTALVAAVFVWLWLHKTGWESERNFYEPIAYALGFALLQLNAQSQIWMLDLFYYRGGGSQWLLHNAPWLSALLNSAVLLYFVYRIALEQQLSWSSTAGRLVLLAAIVMLFSALPVMGLSSALLILLVGFARQSRLLQVMGALALLGFVGWYYYALNITLLYKSMIMLATGVVLLLGYVLLHFYRKPKADAGSKSSELVTDRAWSGQRWAVALTLLLALVGVNHAIWQKEQLLNEGRSVLLELAPVDPRSIMQGDYMRLRFAIANDIRDSRQANDAENDAGYVVVDLDQQGVGRFVALATAASELPEEQIKMQYRIRSNRVQFATNAFFFQEGDAKLFDAARFGEFKVAGNGEMLLKAMYDKDLKLLGENRLD